MGSVPATEGGYLVPSFPCWGTPVGVIGPLAFWRALVFSVENILQFAQFSVEFLNLLDRRFLLSVFGSVVGINLVQPDGAARLSLEQFAIFTLTLLQSVALADHVGVENI